VAGLIWLNAVRRQIRRQAADIQKRETAAEAYYNDLFENAHDIILGLSPDGRLLSLNRAGEKVLGFTREEARGQNLFALTSPDDQATLTRMIQGLEQGKESEHGELTLTTKNGPPVSLRVNLRRQVLPGGLPHLHGVAWDITAHRQAEEALRSSEQRLRRSLEERVRIGRDLHDGIIQSIYAVGLGLGECRRWIVQKPEAAQARLSECVDDLNAVIREVRAFIGGLQPEALKGSELGVALEKMSRSWESAHSATVKLSVDSRAANLLDTDQATHLFQIARESLSNSQRHSGASNVTISLSLDHGYICLEVGDDGRGFDPRAVSPTGRGLLNIKARAADLGALMELKSAPGQGTLARIKIPVSLQRELA
jgi:PAS domain S-box-containing protein